MAEKFVDERVYNEFCESLDKKINLGELITIEENLENLGMKDKTLEDFLEEEGIFQRMSKTKKLEKVEELKNFYSKRRGSGASEKSKLLESYRIILNDSDKEREYNDYLKKVKYGEVSRILQNIKEIYRRTGSLEQSQIEYFVDKISEKIGNKPNANSILYGFLKKENVDYRPICKSTRMENNYDRNYQNEENRQENWKPRNYSNSNKNTPEEDHKNTWKNRESNNEWNPNREKASSGNIAVWVIGGILILLLAVVIWNQNKKNDIPSVTQVQPVPQAQLQSQPQQSESQPQQDQKPKQTYDENNQSNSDNENNENQNGENDLQAADINNDPYYQNLKDVINEVYKGDRHNLENKSEEEIQLMINYIYAKYGYSFYRNQSVANQFRQKKWYKSRGNNIDMEYFENNEFTPEEKYFVDVAGNEYRN